MAAPDFMIETAMRVFVLGAGASFHAGYPLAAEMGKRLAAWVETLPPDHQYRSWLKQIDDLYGTLDDFETILADLMTSTPGSPAASVGLARPYLLGDLKEAIRDHFDAIRSAPTELYNGLVRLLLPGFTAARTGAPCCSAAGLDSSPAAGIHLVLARYCSSGPI